MKKNDTRNQKTTIVLRPKDETSMKTLRKSMMAQKSCCRGATN